MTLHHQMDSPLIWTAVGVSLHTHNIISSYELTHEPKKCGLMVNESIDKYTDIVLPCQVLTS